MLEKLTGLCGTSGHEDAVREEILSAVSEICEDVSVDKTGNIIAFKKGKSAEKKCLVSAHMDEVGFIVKDIDDDGFIKFAAVGGIDSRILPGTGVKINGLDGVIGTKAIHLTAKEERKKPIKDEDLYIDIGASSKEEAERYVSKGDYIYFDSKYVEFGAKCVKAKALDDRAGCSIILELIKEANPYYDTYFCFTVQEEIGCRGSITAARRIKPDFGLVIEGTTCGETLGTPKHLSVTTLGNGPAISVIEHTSMSDAELINKTLEKAERKKIPCQLKRASTGGNDAGNIQATGSGVRTMAIAVPCRYIHSPVSMMKLSDYAGTYKLAKLIIENIFR